MLVPFRAHVVLTGLVLSSGCAMGSHGEEMATTASRGGGIVIEAEEFGSRRFGGLLEGLMGQVTSMRVSRRSGACPEVTFRGAKTVMGSASAAVYLDGSPAADTCVLDHLRVEDVERVEIYPSGYTSRPGYRGDPHGLILVFLAGS